LDFAVRANILMGWAARAAVSVRGFMQMAQTTKKPASRSGDGKVGRVGSLTGNIGKKTKPTAKEKVKSAAEMEKADIIARVTEWAGGPLQALAWYREVQIPALGQQTAETLVRTGRAASVRAYLDHIAVGGFA
jgi:hypothetical protein